MSARKLLQAISLDTISSHLLLMHQVGVVLHVYHQVITLRFPGDRDVHLVAETIGNGPRRIVIHAFPDGMEKLIFTGIAVRTTNKELLIGQGVTINLKGAKKWTMPPLLKLNQSKNALQQFLNRRFESFHRNFKNPLMLELEQVRNLITTFLLYPSQDTLNGLVGLGSGSTPLGDDAILGYILSQRFLGIPLTIVHQLVQTNGLKTTDLAKEMLEDAYLGKYSQTFLDWLAGVQHLHPDNQDQRIAHLGGNSGWMILESFYRHTLKNLKEDIHEFISTYSR